MRHALVFALLLALQVFRPAAAAAHQGPPFPILVDQPVGPYRASVWTDPDIGIGTFFVILEPPKGAEDRPLPQATVRIAVRPTSGRLAEVAYTALPQKVSYGERYFTTVRFDRGEMWRIRVEIQSPRGGGELQAEVEATPDGTIGPIGLLVYSFPFLGMGFLWWKAARRRGAPSAAKAEGNGSGAAPEGANGAE